MSGEEWRPRTWEPPEWEETWSEIIAYQWSRFSGWFPSTLFGDFVLYVIRRFAMAFVVLAILRTLGLLDEFQALARLVDG